MVSFTPPTKMSPCCPNLTLSLLFPTMSHRSHRTFLFLLLATVISPCFTQQALQLQDAILLDDVVQEAAAQCYHGKHRKTGVAYPLSLPGSLSDVDADVSRFRAGSFKRYGVRRFGEFSVPPGVLVRRHVRHLLAVRVNLGNLSSIYDEYADSGGFRRVSPVLGLMVYKLAWRNGATSRVEILVTGAPIRVNFSMAMPALEPGVVPLCMAVGLNGNVSVTDAQAGSNTCPVWDQGHFALVVGGAGDDGGEAEAGDVSRWKLALFGAALGAGGTVLLGLVVVAVATIRRRKTEMAELEQRAYEEEALGVSMVGHVRAPSAAGSRTMPELESEYCASL